jgi:hypothetical protein
VKGTLLAGQITFSEFTETPHVAPSAHALQTLYVCFESVNNKLNKYRIEVVLTTRKKLFFRTAHEY